MVRTAGSPDRPSFRGLRPSGPHLGGPACVLLHPSGAACPESRECETVPVSRRGLGGICGTGASMRRRAMLIADSDSSGGNDGKAFFTLGGNSPAPEKPFLPLAGIRQPRKSLFYLWWKSASPGKAFFTFGGNSPALEKPFLPLAEIRRPWKSLFYPRRKSARLKKAVLAYGEAKMPAFLPNRPFFRDLAGAYVRGVAWIRWLRPPPADSTHRLVSPFRAAHRAGG